MVVYLIVFGLVPPITPTTYNSRSKHDNLTNDPIFLICSIRLYISFLYFNTFKVQFYGLPFAFSGLWNIRLHAKNDIFKSVNIYILFLTLSIWHVLFPILSQSHGLNVEWWIIHLLSQRRYFSTSSYGSFWDKIDIKVHCIISDY